MAQREDANALRKLAFAVNRVDFSSNDYLGFSASDTIFNEAHKYLVDNGVVTNGATGSRLISGNYNLYSVVEDTIARYHDAKGALVFNSGYDANVGLFSSVPQKNDVILFDEYIHASIRDGIRLSNASAYKFGHNNLTDLEKRLKNTSEKKVGETYVVTESVFSMDGDSPDMENLVELCATYNARLIVDEAHAFGVFGEKGEGLLQSLSLHDKVFARIITFGKALGCHGAAVLGSEAIKQYLVNFARSFIYTTALPPHSLATIFTAYKFLIQRESSRLSLKNIISFFTAELSRLKMETFIESNSAIHCAVLPGNENVKYIASVLQQNGFDVKPILSPTVPAGEERLRFCLHSYNSKQQVTQVLELLASLHSYPLSR